MLKQGPTRIKIDDQENKQKIGLIDTTPKKRKIVSSHIQIQATVTLNFNNGDVSVAKEEWCSASTNIHDYDKFIQYADVEHFLADAKGRMVKVRYNIVMDPMT